MRAIFIIQHPDATSFQRDDAMGILATDSESQAIRFAYAREEEGAEVVRYERALSSPRQEGEAAVPLRYVLNFIDCLAIDGKGLRHEYLESRSGSMVRIPNFHAEVVSTAASTQGLREAAHAFLEAADARDNEETATQYPDHGLRLRQYKAAREDLESLLTSPTTGADGVNDGR